MGVRPGAVIPWRSAAAGSGAVLIAKANPKEDQDESGSDGGDHPNGPPVVQNSARRGGLCVEVHDSAANPRANEHADSVGDESNQTLSGCAQCLRRFLLYLDLARAEQQIAADSLTNT